MTGDRANEALRTVVEATASTVGNDFFRKLVRSLATTLNVGHAFVGELIGEDRDRVRTHALWVHGSLAQNIEYPLAGSPCENVISTRGMWHIPNGMRECIPELGVESYLGFRVTDASGTVIGLIGIMDDQPLTDSHVAGWILTNIAARTGAELERVRVSAQIADMASFAEMNPAPVLRISRSGTILVGNQAAQQLFKSQHLASQSWFDLCPGVDRDSLHRWLDNGKEPTQQEVQIGKSHFLFTYRYDDQSELIHVYGMDITERKRMETVVQNIAVGVSAVTGEEFFRSLTRYLCEILNVEYAFIGELDSVTDDKIETIAVHAHGKSAENFIYRLTHTPCENVVGKQLRSYPRDVRTHFPLDAHLVEFDVEGYIGSPLFDSRGRALGLIVVMSQRPMETPQLAESLLKIFAVRASAELERRRQEMEILHLKDQLAAENVYLQEEIAAAYPVDRMIGESAEIQDIRSKIRLVASTDSTVMIQGETGTGKELIARAIHAHSRRKDRPLITVNCATIPKELIESELFGHARGAFTGATVKRVGRFELANGGTIFLDEIHELRLDMQAKLLRVLQEREFERVGESQPVKIDTRFIAASNIPFGEEVESGRFRADLFYRLNVFPIHIPPLRERSGDIPSLAVHFVHRFNLQMGKQVHEIEPKTMRRLLTYGWPGNIRELENIIERAMILAQGHRLEIDEVMLDRKTAIPVKKESIRTWKSYERAYLLEVMEQTDGVIHGPRGAASILGIHPSTLRSRLKRLGISPKKKDGQVRAS